MTWQEWVFLLGIGLFTMQVVNHVFGRNPRK
jgi:hypothetical protein